MILILLFPWGVVLCLWFFLGSAEIRHGVGINMNGLIVRVSWFLLGPLVRHFYRYLYIMQIVNYLCYLALRIFTKLRKNISQQNIIYVCLLVRIKKKFISFY